MQKGASLDSSKISTKEIVKMMTTNGLNALGFSEFNGRKIAEMEEEIEKTENYNFLYALNSNEVDFKDKNC